MSNTITDFTSWSEITQGNGNTERTTEHAKAFTGTSSDAYGVAYKAVDMSWQNNVDVDSDALFGPAGIAVSVYSWIRLAVDITTRSDLANEGIQFIYHRNGNKMYAQSHDGTTLESTLILTSTESPHFSNARHQYKFVLTPGVSVKFYYDDVLKATHTTHIPSGSGTGVKIAVGAAHPGASGSYGQSLYVYEIVEDRCMVYPSDAITRVTSLIHRYDRGTYTLELGLGEVTADFGLPEWDSKPKPAIPEKPEIPEPYPDVIPWPEPIPPIEPPPKTQPWFPDVVPWPEEDPFAVDTTGPTPEHRGGLVGGLGSLRGGRVGLSGGGISGYRRRKLIQEAIERNERAAKRAARLGRESAGIAPPKPAFGGGIVGGISPAKKKKPPVESYRNYFEGF